MWRVLQWYVWFLFSSLSYVHVARLVIQWTSSKLFCSASPLTVYAAVIAQCWIAWSIMRSLWDPRVSLWKCLVCTTVYPPVYSAPDVNTVMTPIHSSPVMSSSYFSSSSKVDSVPTSLSLHCDRPCSLKRWFSRPSTSPWNVWYSCAIRLFCYSFDFIFKIVLNEVLILSPVVADNIRTLSSYIKYRIFGYMYFLRWWLVASSGYVE